MAADQVDRACLNPLRSLEEAARREDGTGTPDTYAKVLEVAGLRAVGGQVAIENVLNNALLYFPSFYAVQSLYQGGRAADGVAKFRASWREDVPAIWSFWVPVQTANL